MGVDFWCHERWTTVLQNHFSTIVLFHQMFPSAQPRMKMILFLLLLFSHRKRKPDPPKNEISYRRGIPIINDGPQFIARVQILRILARRLPLKYSSRFLCPHINISNPHVMLDKRGANYRKPSPLNYPI